jgi:hypothetical protein
MRKIILLIVFFKAMILLGQSDSDSDVWMVKKIHSNTLKNGLAYDWLRSLTKMAPGRLAGSPAAAAAVELTRQIIDTLGFDRVYIQPCKVPHWVREKRRLSGS